MWLHSHERRQEERLTEKQTAAQFQWAAGEKPRRFRTRLEKSLHNRPTAGQDAEEAERQRWLHILADLVRHSPTPMGQLLAAQPSNVSVLGGGKRTSTLRSGVRAIEKFVNWLHIACGLQCPQTEHPDTSICLVDAGAKLVHTTLL